MLVKWSVVAQMHAEKAMTMELSQPPTYCPPRLRPEDVRPRSPTPPERSPRSESPTRRSWNKLARAFDRVGSRKRSTRIPDFSGDSSSDDESSEESDDETDDEDQLHGNIGPPVDCDPPPKQWCRLHGKYTYR